MGLAGGVGEAGLAGLAGVAAAAAFAGAIGAGGLSGASTCWPVVFSPMRVMAFSGKFGNSAPGTADFAAAIFGDVSSPITIIGDAEGDCAEAKSGRARLSNMTREVRIGQH